MVISFGYDDAGQLTSEARSGANSYSISYAYDNAGNRTSKTLGGVTESYTYDDANKLTAAGSKTYGYDNAGNVTSVTSNSQTTSLAWDAQGRLTGITYPNSSTNSFTYNGIGQRVGKTDSGGTLSFVRADDQVDSPVLSDSAATYVQGPKGLISEKRSSTTKFYHADGLGTTRQLTSTSEAITDTLETDAFGNQWTPGSSGSTPSPFGFAGQHGYQKDVDSGLMLLGHRYYDSATGRLISRDPIRAGYNWFVYCDNDPVNRVDPAGLQSNPPIIRPPGEQKPGVSEPPQGWPYPSEFPGVPVPTPDPGRTGPEYPPPPQDPDPDLDPDFKDPYYPPLDTGEPLPGLGDAVKKTALGIAAGLAVVALIVIVCCFDEDTPVLMADGTTRPIKDIRTGDRVLSRSEITGQVAPKQVLSTSVTRVRGQMARVHLSSGEVITATANHPFYVEGKGFVPAAKLTPRSKIMIASGEFATIVDCTTKDVPAERAVYNLCVEGFHTFFVGTSSAWVRDSTVRDTSDAEE